MDQMSKGIISDTFRPCFASLVCKKIRGRLRVYVHITVEGKSNLKEEEKTAHQDIPMEKEMWDVISERRQLRILQITEVGLENLAERGNFNSVCGKTGSIDLASKWNDPEGR